MTKPFKFRYVNEIAGTFTAGIAVVLIVSIVLVARAQKWFQRVDRITIMLPAKGSFGLKDGGDVRMMGVTVGAVDQINPPSTDTGRMTMVVHVDPRFAPFICNGDDSGDNASRAIIHIPLGLGDPYLEITRGEGKPLPAKAILTAAPETGASEAISQTVEDVRTRVLPAVEALLKEYKGVATDWRNQQGAVQQAFLHIDHVAANLERTDGVLGRLTTDKQLADNLDQAVIKLTTSADDIHALLANLQKTTAELPKIAQSASSQVDKLPAMMDQTRQVMAEATKTLKNLQDSTAQLPAVMSSLKQTVDTLPGVMAQTQQTLVEVQKLVKGMQELPLIRENVEHTPQAAELQPTDVGGPP